MTKPKEKLYITYHKVNEEGKSQNPSFLIGKIKQLFPMIKIQDEDDGEWDIAHVLSDDGLSYLAEGFREYQRKEITDLWRELYLYYKGSEETKRILDKLIQEAFFINTEKGISKSAAELLYGQELKGSVTRLEKYAGCAFAHFMSYGLSLEERQEYKLAIPDIGTIFHNAIDHFSKRLGEGEYTWHSIPDDVREVWAKESVAYAVEAYESSVLRSSARNEYMINRMERITVRTLWALCNQIKQGSFEPMGYEQQFRHEPDVMLSLTGRIDRESICQGNRL
jgi:ATP-dependent helicase/nuclease subunit B